MTRPTWDRPTIVDDFEVVLRGDLPDDLTDYARRRITPEGEHIGEPVLHTRVKLTQQTNPAIERPVRAQVNLHLKDRMVRAQASGLNGYEAIDRVRDRLRARLARYARHWEAIRGTRPSDEPNEWRRGEEPTQRPPYYPRPVEERQVIRHKTFAPRRIDPHEAAYEMEQLDYDFHLFTDEQTAVDAVVYRRDSSGYELQRVTPKPETAIDLAPIALNPQPAPRLSLDEARDRLELGGLPFVFFVDRDSGRGAVLYHRYDGHYGLITPSG
jgi:ribosome-associated translation inhibitor RaiA